MKLLVDMNLSPRWCDMLAGEGVEAVHWSTLGAATAADSEIMRAAAAEGLIVLTHDLDFGALLAASGRQGPSVIQLRGADVRPQAALAPLLLALRQCRDELAAGALLTVDARRYRVTLLPLRA